jgi:SGNH hydrolase-like domain, acetyltransferase AlgX
LYRYLSYNLSASLALTQLKAQWQQLLSTLTLKPTSSAKSEELSQESHRRLVALWVQGLTQRAHKAQAQPIVVLNTFDPRRSSEASRRIETQRLQDIEARLTEAGVPVVRVEDTFSAPRCRTQGSCYLFRDGHWSALGHELLAEAVHRRLADAATRPVQARSD